jgi:Cu2+-exporting ATPase
VVLAVAALTASWWLVHDINMLFPATLAVLVISCPCALSLATPAAIASSSRALLEQGVLLTRSAAIEALSGVDTIVFDKTGTLTSGLPSISATVINDERTEFDEESVLQIAALLELDSSHPVASAFDHVEVRRRADGLKYRLGNAQFTRVNVVDMPGNLARLWLADDVGWIARFDLDDGLRGAAAQTIASLKDRGLDLIILSGDQQRPVASVAEHIGIDNWRAGQSPKMKMEFLELLQAEGKTVLMIGDGINDAPVLSVADISMTVSGASELANSTADFILTGSSLSLVETVFKTALQTKKVIRQNLIWALTYNLMAVPFAAAGLIVPWMAALGMSLSSLLVVLNSGRLATRRVAMQVAEYSGVNAS